MNFRGADKYTLIRRKIELARAGFQARRGDSLHVLAAEVTILEQLRAAGIQNAPVDRLNDVGLRMEATRLGHNVANPTAAQVAEWRADVNRIYHAEITLQIRTDQAVKKNNDPVERAAKLAAIAKVVKNNVVDGVRVKKYNVTGTRAQIDAWRQDIEQNEMGADYVIGVNGKVSSIASGGGGGGYVGGYIRDSACLLQTIDAGSGLLAISAKTPDGFCGEGMIADILAGVRSHMDGGENKHINRHTPEITVDRIIKYIETMRKDAVGYVEKFEAYRHHGPKCFYSPQKVEVPTTPITEGATLFEIFEVAKQCNVKYFIALDGRKNIIIDWRNPALNTNVRLNNGIITCINSNHATYVNIALKASQHIDAIIPKKNIQGDWSSAKIRHVVDNVSVDDIIALDPEKIDKRIIYYVRNKIHQTALDLIANGNIPSIISFNKADKEIESFSFGLVLVKYTPDHDKAVVRVAQLNELHPKWKLTYNGQSLKSLTLIEFEKSFNKSNLSPTTYLLMKTLEDISKVPFGFAHTCIFPTFREGEKYTPIDVEKCYAYCMSEMVVPQFTYDNDPAPFSGKLVDGGFYRITCNIGWPTHGANTFISGAEAKEYIADGLMSLADIDIELVATFQHKAGLLKQFIKGIFDYYGKSGANELNGLFSGVASTQKNESFWTQSIEELYYYMDQLKGKLGIEQIEIKPRNKGEAVMLYRCTCSEPPQAVYSSYLPIHLMTYRQNNLYMYKSAKLVCGGDLSKLVGIFTDCMLVHKPIGDYPKKSELTDVVFGRLVVEEHISECRRQYTPRKVAEYPAPLVWKVEERGRNDIYESIIGGKSYLIDADAGTGKSYFVKQLIKYCREREIEPMITAATGTAAQKLDDAATTTHSALGLRIGDDDIDDSAIVIDRFNSTTKIFIVDEGFFLNQQALTSLINKKMRYPNCAIVFVGSSIQLNCDSMLTSYGSYLHKLCDGNRITLTLNYRFINDPLLGKFCGAWVSYLNNAGPIPNLADYNFPAEHCDLSITATIDKATQLNDFWAGVYGKGKTVTRDTLPFGVFEGMPLIQFKKNKRGELTLNNGQHYIIKEVLDESLILYFSDENRNIIKDVEPIELPDSIIKKKVLRGYSYTVHRAQGANFKIPFSVYQYDLPFKWGPTWRNWQYVACSRSDYIRNLNICTGTPIIATSKYQKGYIYKITDVTGRAYIGSTRNVIKRWEEHQAATEKCIFHDAIRTMGWACFTGEIIEQFESVSDQELLLHEQGYIDTLAPYYNEIDAVKD